MKVSIRFFLVLLSLATVACAKPQFVIIRVPMGQNTPTNLTYIFSNWQNSGQVADILFLRNGKGEKKNQSAKFDSITIFKFADEASYNSWQKTLASTLPKELIVKHARALVDGTISESEFEHSFFLINEYTPKVNQEKYNQFAQSYLKPLYEAMLSTKMLVRYTNYIEDGAVGDANAYSVLEYRDVQAFEAMPQQKLKIRAYLTANNTGYASYDKVKDTLRVDGGGTFATYTDLNAHINSK